MHVCCPAHANALAPTAGPAASQRMTRSPRQHATLRMGPHGIAHGYGLPVAFGRSLLECHRCRHEPRITAVCPTRGCVPSPGPAFNRLQRGRRAVRRRPPSSNKPPFASWSSCTRRLRSPTDLLMNVRGRPRAVRLTRRINAAQDSYFAAGQRRSCCRKRRSTSDLRRTQGC